jgi:calcium permeable stress-gated cation channel
MQDLPGSSLVSSLPTWASRVLIRIGFILYMVTRECVYFINLRQAYLLSPHYANRLSSRTVLFSCVPKHILDERKLRRIFGDTVKNIWIPRETDELDQLVDERDQTAIRLEKAEILLIKKANAAYRKAVKHGHPDIQAAFESPPNENPKKADVTVSTEGSASPMSPGEYHRSDGTPIMKTSYGFMGPPDVNGSVAAQWIPASQRPVHRPLANYGRRVDTIKWTRKRLKELAPKISQLRKQYRKGVGRPIPAVFIEFHTQVDAQSAYQTLAHHRANHMVPDIVGVRPHEIVWPSLYMRWWERIIRRFLIQGSIAVMVIFWAAPAAFIGFISNVKFLTQEVPFLGWLNLLPSVILGLISGLLPAVALAMLMAIVPMIMRCRFR